MKQTLWEAEASRDILCTRRPVPLGLAVSLTKTLLDRLRLWHEGGRLHLRLTPDCILGQGTRVIGLNRGAGEDFRNLWYMAPEVRLSDHGQTGFSSDIYSVCAIFYGWVLGRPLGEREVLGRGLEESLARIPEAQPGLPEPAVEALRCLLARGLHTLPRRRYQTIGELYRALEELEKELEKREELDCILPEM